MESSMAIQGDTMELHPEPTIEPNLPPQQIPHLPPEIISNILSRLPVKSLLQFRSVSKSWCSIISGPKFVKTHLNICSKNDEFAHHRLIFISASHGGLEIVENCHLSSVFNVFSVNPTELDCPMKYPYSSTSIVGSINGLICIDVDDYIFFWNPSIRISKKLPVLGSHRTHSYGFGYDESTDDYKLVGLFPTIVNEDIHGVVVYSLRTDCWRNIGNFPSGIELLSGSGKFVNGAIHWAAGSTLPFSHSIVSLDLAKETFGEVAQPSYGDGGFELSLGVLGECLSVLCHYGSHADVWMMKEYGVRDSWTKLARIPFNANNPRAFMCRLLLYISKNGEILLQDGRIVVYDPKTNSLRHTPDIHNIRRACLDASVYIESIVSPLIQ